MKIRDLLTESVIAQPGQYILKKGNLFYVLETNLVNGEPKPKVWAHFVDKMYRNKDGKIKYTRSKPVVSVGLDNDAKLLSPNDAYHEYKILTTPMRRLSKKD